MKPILFFAMLCFLFVVTVPSFADGMHKPYTGSPAFERMKKLAGDWEASMDMGQGPQKVKANYKLTAAGSALIETFHAGEPHEMVSVYHDNKNKKLMMTHYCAEHNQPKLILQEFDNKQLTMDLSNDSDVDVAHDSHIHSFSVQFDGADKMTQVWTSFQNGKKGMVVKMDFTRSASGAN